MAKKKSVKAKLSLGSNLPEEEGNKSNGNPTKGRSSNNRRRERRNDLPRDIVFIGDKDSNDYVVTAERVVRRFGHVTLSAREFKMSMCGRVWKLLMERNAFKNWKTEMHPDYMKVAHWTNRYDEEIDAPELNILIVDPDFVPKEERVAVEDDEDDGVEPDTDYEDQEVDEEDLGIIDGNKVE